MPHYGDLQNAIYGAGLSGVQPAWPVDFATLKARAEAAAKAVRVAASSPDADAVSASTAFSVPVTRFGRLCGVAEGELEVTTRGVEDEGRGTRDE